MVERPRCNPRRGGRNRRLPGVFVPSSGARGSAAHGRCRRRSFGRTTHLHIAAPSAPSHGGKRASSSHGGERAKKLNLVEHNTSSEEVIQKEEGGGFIRRAGRSDGEPDSVERAPRPGCVSTPQHAPRGCISSLCWNFSAAREAADSRGGLQSPRHHCTLTTLRNGADVTHAGDFALGSDLITPG